MKVAELVIERADAQRRFAELSKRLTDQAKRQEGDDDPKLGPTLDEAFQLAQTIFDLTVQINVSNNANGNMERIAYRDQLDRQLKLLRSVADAASPKPQAGFRVQASELRWLPNFDVADLHAKADALAKERREINTRIQAQDWTLDQT